MIDRYLLRYFLAVIDHGNFTRAAEACSVTQATLSIGIAKLETHLGQRLFRRTNRRVDLTQAGVRFAAHAREIEEAFHRAELSVTQATPARLLRLGVLNTISVALIGQLAGQLSASGDVQLELIEGRARELKERLVSGRIDLALTLHMGGSGTCFEPVLTEGYALALPATHRCAQMDSVDAGLLADNVMIVRRHCEVLTQTSQHFTQRGVRPFFAARTTRDDHALAYVAAGLGVTIMPESFHHAGVVRVPMTDFTPVRTLGVEALAPSEAYWHCVDLARRVLAEGAGCG